MYKSYKFRLYPNNEQKELLNKNFGSSRFIYNRVMFTLLILTISFHIYLK